MIRIKSLRIVRQIKIEDDTHSYVTVYVWNDGNFTLDLTLVGKYMGHATGDYSKFTKTEGATENPDFPFK